VELDEIVSFTSAGHEASRRVMERIGLHRDPADDFDNPSFPAGHPLRRHVLYRITRSEWNRLSAAATKHDPGLRG
jgi:ribosomal-protein-alanine N-acetyltransferase